MGRKKTMKKPQSLYDMNVRQLNSRLVKRARIEREGYRYFLWVDDEYELSGDKGFVIDSCKRRGLFKKA